MPFLDPWNTAYEGEPADSENINLGAGRIRDFKVNVRERLNVDHSFGDTADNGEHLKVTLIQAAADPGLSGSDACLYTKSVAGNSELFYKDNGGNVIQLTAAGIIDATPFPSGTVMLFAQAAPPAGWTQVGANNDVLLRLVNDGSGGGTGGSWTIGGLSAASVTGVLTTTTTTLALTLAATATVNSHTLTAGELPAHTHGVSVPVSTGPIGQGSGAANAATFDNSGHYTTDNGTGGGAGHSHTATATATDNGSTATSHSASAAGTSTTVSADGSWRPAYLNVIAASKN